MTTSTIACKQAGCEFTFTPNPNAAGILRCPKCGTAIEGTAVISPDAAAEIPLPATPRPPGLPRATSEAERQAADLTALRKFHEKALGELERLRMEKGVLKEQKEALELRVVEGVAVRRNFEHASADLERLKRDHAILAAEKAALQKRFEELTAELAAPPEPVSSAAITTEMPPVPPPKIHMGGVGVTGGSRLNPPSSPTVRESTLRPPTADSGSKLRPPTSPVTRDSALRPPTADTGTRVPEVDGNSGKRIKYLCEGCGKKLGAPQEFAGTFGTCTHCGHRGQVPAESTR